MSALIVVLAMSALVGLLLALYAGVSLVARVPAVSRWLDAHWTATWD